jgi:uncharacterized protein (TIGR02996 family)
VNIYDSPEYAAFIARIREQPDDDLPRLVAADWLEEQGEAELAEFVRVQVELALLRNRHTNWRRVRELMSEEKRLHHANYHAHLHTLPIISHPTAYPNRIGIYSGDGYVEFVRGFVGIVRIRGCDWIEHADAILRLNPVRLVYVFDCPAMPRYELLTEVQQAAMSNIRIMERMTHRETIDVLSRVYAVMWPGIKFTFETGGNS